jgi:hypothetical protein
MMVVATLAITLLAKIATGTMRPAYEWDHIDPRWGENRDYQLVCGLENYHNFSERERTLNVQKSNRFLPWRVAKGEIGQVPINPGDLCQFLDQESGEWVLEEFMGEWWFEKTKLLCGNFKGGRVQYEQNLGIFNPDYATLRVENSRKNGISNRDNKRGIFDPNNWQKVLDGCAKENARRMKPIVVIDPQGKKHYHESLNGAARHHNLSAGNLCSVLNGTRAHTKQYTAFYL